MSKVKYQGNSFEEWWKAHYGTDYNGKSGIYKTDSMNDADYSIGQKLYNSYLNEQDLTNKYNTSKETLTQNKRDAEIAADVSYQRLQKYLPQQLAKQGLYGTGMSEDAYLKLHNNYRNDVADIGKSYDANLTSLENAYRTDINDERRAVGTDIESVIDKYNAEEIAAEERRKADEDRTKNNQLAMYKEAYDGLSTGYFKTVDDVNNYIANYQGTTSESQWANLQNYANEIIDGIKDAESFKARGLTTNAKFDNPSGTQTYEDGDDFDISISGKTYEIESAGKVSGDVVEWASANGAGSGSVFIFDDEIYVNRNGTIYLIKPVDRAKSGEYYEDYKKLKQVLSGNKSS